MKNKPRAKLQMSKLDKNWATFMRREPGTIDGLMNELDVADRLHGMINRCLKQLLTVRDVKSLSSAAASDSIPQIGGPRKAS
jgi:hypothetical protein